MKEKIRRKEEGKMYKIKRFSNLPNSHRGLGRSYLVGGLGGALAAHSTKEDVDKDVDLGYSDEEVVRRAKKRGTRRGGLLGGIIGGISGGIKGFFSGGPLGALAGATIGGVTGAGLSALGARWGAGKNARTRLKKSRVGYSRRWEE